MKDQDVSLSWVRLEQNPSSQIKVDEVADDALSDKSLSTMKNWIECCNNQHDCKCLSSITLLPSRYLDVGSTEKPYLRLLENDERTEGTYLALSHCWGHSQHFVLLSSNLNAFKRIIDEMTMPKTFRDAVQLTRLLDVRYLWVGSLCII